MRNNICKIEKMLSRYFYFNTRVSKNLLISLTAIYVRFQKLMHVKSQNAMKSKENNHRKIFFAA